MKMDRDLGIYVFDCDESILINWFNSKLGLPKEVSEIEGHKFLTYNSCTATFSEIPDYSIEIMVIPSSQEWSESVFLARAISKELGIKVLCDPGSEYPNSDPLGDEMLEIFEEREKVVFVDEDNA